MADKLDWMSPRDMILLEGLANSGDLPIQTPSTLARNLEMNRADVNERLRILTQNDLVNRVSRGYYRITELGEEVAAGDYDSDELPYKTNSSSESE